ncbi:MAG: hypothetical protein EU549_00475 [Promethearchaeota archaeon]|nr:MAG: hypothetical protein EU549_00475 [Candidatus Lokiarchaeota archaeon]
MEWKIYAVPGIRIKYPRNWLFQDQNLATKEMLVLFSKEKIDCQTQFDTFTRNVTIAAEGIDLEKEPYKEVKNDPEKLLEKYTDEKMKILEDKIKDFKLIRKEKIEIKESYRSFKGDSAVKITYEGEYYDFNLRWTQYFTIIGGDIVCVLTATDFKNKFNNKFIQITDEMINSMEITP